MHDTLQESSNELYESFSEEICEELGRHGKKATIRPGTRLIEQGTNPAYLIILDKGSVEISVPAGGQSISLEVSGRGKVCGLRSIVSGVLAETDVTAVEECEVTLIPAGLFVDMLKQHPEMYFAIAKVLSADLKTAEKILREMPSTRRRSTQNV